MKLNFLFFCSFFILTIECPSQRANFWAFEPYFGLNFKNDPDIKDTSVILTSLFQTGTGSNLRFNRQTLHDFSVCDRMGKLLFYSNGVYLRNKKHQIVDTGLYLNINNHLDLNADWTGTNLANRNRNIVCTINDSLFYIFSLYYSKFLQNKPSSPHSEIRFCAIQLINDSPVVLIRDSVLNYTGFPSNINSVKVGEGEYWLILRDTAKYASIKIQTNYISNPNYFTFYEPKNKGRDALNPSSITCSFDKSKIYSAYSIRWSPNLIDPQYYDSSEFHLFSYNFDAITGTISTQKKLDYEFNYKFHKEPYFIYTSPDSRSVYVCLAKEKDQVASFAPTYFIEQLFMQGDTISARASHVFSNSDFNKFPFQMQLGYNGKLYFANRLDLGYITQPDSFPSFSSMVIRENYLYNLATNGAFPGIDFDYHKLAFKVNTSNCKAPFLQNISDTQFYKKFVWFINETDSFTSLHLPLNLLGYGKFSIRLKGTNKDNFYASFTDSIIINPPPKARFNTTSLQGCQYVAYSFIDSSSASIALNDSVNCRWSFGDGTFLSYRKIKSETGRLIKHIYTTNGIYTVQLIIENGYCSDTFTYLNNVLILPAPKPGFTITAKNWCDNPIEVTIRTNDTLNVIRSYFDLGNNDTISTSNRSIVYTYYNSGKYMVRQRLLGTSGCITEDSMTILVKIGLSSKDTTEVLFTTVIDSITTRTVWKSLPLAINYSINNKLTSDTFYIDKSGTPNQKSMKYLICGIDSCGNKSANSPIVQTIYLKTSNINFNEYALLEYTPYETWKNGVLKYSIEYFNTPTNEWLPISTLPPTLFNYKANILPSTNGILNNTPDICYRIIAMEKNGNSQISTSNVSCVPVYPVAFIPNAFSPNHDGVNDYYKPITAGLNAYIFEIYNRWGTLMYIDTPESKGWDGTFRGEPVESGTYLYRLSAAGYLNSPATNESRLVERQGTLLLVK